MGAIVWPLLIYWLVFFVVCYTIVEFGQDQFYDEVTPKAWLKVGIGALILAAFQTWLKTSFDTMFTSDLPWTALQGIVWFLVFMFAFQFHPQHAAAIGIVTMLLIPGVASMGVDSMLKPTPTLAPVRTLNQSKPVRRPLGPVAAPPAKEQPATK
jgi:hypothetical protein